jgi:hypothetical protein
LAQAHVLSVHVKLKIDVVRSVRVQLLSAFENVQNRPNIRAMQDTKRGDSVEIEKQQQRRRKRAGVQQIKSTATDKAQGKDRKKRKAKERDLEG